MRAPYWLTGRRWATDVDVFGYHKDHKGVEIRIATEQGAVILNVLKDGMGRETFVLHRGQHVDLMGVTRGVNQLVTTGLVEGSRADAPATQGGLL